MKSPLKRVRTMLARRQVRATPTGFGFALADSISFVDPATWDRVTGSASVLLSRKYLRTLERFAPESLTPGYAMVFRGQEPVAAVVTQSIVVRPEQFRKVPPGTDARNASSAPVRKRDRLAKLAGKPLEGVEQRMLVCGNLLCWGNHGVAVAPGVKEESIYAGVAEAVYRIRRARALEGKADLIVAKDFTAATGGADGALCTYSYKRVETEPNMVLSIDPRWKTFDDYLGAMNSKYRGDIKRVHKDIDAAGLSVSREPLSALDAKEIHDLYLQVHQNARVRLFQLREGFLPALAEEFGSDFRCTRLTRDGQTLGFVTSLKDGEECIGYHVGFDREANAKAPIYFRLLQQTIDDAISMGCRKLSLGRTALEPKAKLGAKPEPMHIWVRHRVPAMNLIVRAVLRGVHHDEAPARKVMKSDS